MKKNFERSLASRSNRQIITIRKLPKRYKDDVYKLYSFLFVTSNFAQSDPIDTEGFKYILRGWQSIKRDELFSTYKRSDDSVNEHILANIAYLVHRYELNTKDVDDYLRSVALVMRNKSIQSSQEFARYLQLSSEAPAALLTKVTQLPNVLVHHAKIQAKATKFLYMLLSVPKDVERGRCFFPSSELKKFGLKSLDYQSARKNPKEFKEFIDFQLNRYHSWQQEARRGDDFLPKKLKPIVRYNRTQQDYIASKIEKNPMCLFSDIAPMKFHHRIKARASSIKR